MGLKVAVVVAVVATYSLMEVSCMRPGGTFNTSGGGGGGWGGWASFNQSGGGGGGWGGWPSFNQSGGGRGGWGGWPSFNQSGGGGGWGSGWPSFNRTGGNCPTTTRNRTRGGPTKITVGGPQRWNFGFNYSDWATKSAPFYVNDILVFKYDPPTNGSHPHSVYLLPDWQSYQKCDLSRAKRLAGPTQGRGRGFEFELRPSWQPYFFACGESNGFHCRMGMMKFLVTPTFRWAR